MKLTLVFVALAEATANGFWNFENRNHICRGPRDCDIKCQDKNYTQILNTITGLKDLRCAGSNSDNTYLAAICRAKSINDPPVDIWKRTSCQHVNGLLCSPADANYVKKSLFNYCIMEPDRYEEFREFCKAGKPGLEIPSALIGDTLRGDPMVGVAIRGVPFDCNPDYLP